MAPPLQIHPWTVLGVDRDASPDEIRAAFREKSKKYHPDLGGDEWAFRMVQQAYESLLVDSDRSGYPIEAAGRDGTSGENAGGWRRDADPWTRHPGEASNPSRPRAEEDGEDPESSGKIEIESSWLTHIWPNAVRWFHPRRGRRSGDTAAEGKSRRRADFDRGKGAGATAKPHRTPSAEALLSFKTVEVELVWIRFVSEPESARDDPTIVEEPGESTLSVCLIVSWPPASAIDDAIDHPEAPATLRSVIDVFESLKHGAGPMASRSCIEEGRFVGWMSYPDVIQAETAFKRFRQGVARPGLSIRLLTRQERLPFQWRAGFQAQPQPRENRNGHRPIFSS